MDPILHPVLPPETIPPPPPKGNKLLRILLLGLLILLLLVLGGVALLLGLPPKAKVPEYISYRNFELLVLEDVPRNTYLPDEFTTDAMGRIWYDDGLRRGIHGIDVSYYQGDIDWEAVAGAGIEFAIIRVGYRGYSKGTLQLDVQFHQNMRGALEAGLKVGVYFFSQALSPQEAEEEARFVLKAISPYLVTYPVIFDWEFVQSDSARTVSMEGELLTQCALAFTQVIEEAGYRPMIYFNQDLGYLFYQLDQIREIPFWLAEYDDVPDFYYHFDLWQYTHQGKVPGITGYVDLNLAFQDLSQRGEGD